MTVTIECPHCGYGFINRRRGGRCPNSKCLARLVLPGEWCLPVDDEPTYFRTVAGWKSYAELELDRRAQQERAIWQDAHDGNY